MALTETGMKKNMMSRTTDRLTRRWTRTRDLALPPGAGNNPEMWEMRESTKEIVTFPMRVRHGKPFDVLRMKGQSADQMRTWTSQVRRAVGELYAQDSPRRIVTECPCCGVSVEASSVFCHVHGVAYHRCDACGHVFVREQPTAEILERMFTDNAEYAQDYVSKDNLEQRLREIVGPKLDWVRATYQQQYGKGIRSVVDVGAGGGHFVACCQRTMLAAEGYEINRAAVAFAKSALNVELKREDFVTAAAESGHHDLITCWGLLEYTPEPARFVAAARQRLAAGSGMLVLEVPRADAFGSAIQAQFPESVWRHLSPATHVNIFSDASIANLLYDNGFRPVAAWYFGMDFYELLCQFAAELDDDRLLTRLGTLVAPMQAKLDAAEFVDDLIIAAVPI